MYNGCLSIIYMYAAHMPSCLLTLSSKLVCVFCTHDGFCIPKLGAVST